MLLLAWTLAGCVDSVQQVAGTGAHYSTRCSAEMEAKGPEWFARCEPPACDERFHSVALSHVIVALDPSGKVAGYAERACVQDLSAASALFQPVVEGATPTAPPASPEVR